MPWQAVALEMETFNRMLRASSVLRWEKEPMPEQPVTVVTPTPAKFIWPWANPNVQTWLAALAVSVGLGAWQSLRDFISAHPVPSAPIINVQPAAPVVAPVTPPAVEPVIKLWQPDATGEPGKGNWVQGRVVGPWEKK